MAALAPSELAYAPLKALVAAAGSELHALCREGHRLQALIGSHVAAAGVAQEQAIEDAQMLDRLVQHQQALAEVLRRLAELIPQDLEIELDAVLGPLRLSGLAGRLAGLGAAGANLSGELELL